MTKNKFTTCLWFDGEAEAALTFYVSMFEGAKLGAITKYPEGSENTPAKQPSGSVMCVMAELPGYEIMGLNGGSQFKPNEAVSMMVNCEDQAEIDRLWDGFIKNGGEESVCGWLKDKWGFSWQINSRELNEMYLSPDKAAVKRAQEAMMKMKKLDIAALKKAFNGK